MNGIIFSDLFITNKDIFIDVFSRIYEERKVPIDEAIDNLNGILSEYTTTIVTPIMHEKFEKIWDSFEREVLLNDNDLQLSVIYRGDATGQHSEFSQIVKQRDVEGISQTERGRQYGIQSGHELIKASMLAVKASKVEKILQNHVSTFLSHLNSNISLEEAQDIHKYHEYNLISKYQNTHLQHLYYTTTKWREAFINSNSNNTYFAGQGLGQSYEAFMAHLADHHRDFYDYLASAGKTNISYGALKGSVYTEEGGVVQGGHYAELLHTASSNNTPWYAGGDIVIVDPSNMQVIYNIQLKTTTRKVATVFVEKVARLRKVINIIKNEENPKRKAELLFEYWTNSIANQKEFDQLPEEDLNNLIKKSLSDKILSKYNISLFSNI